MIIEKNLTHNYMRSYLDLLPCFSCFMFKRVFAFLSLPMIIAAQEYSQLRTPLKASASLFPFLPSLTYSLSFSPCICFHNKASSCFFTLFNDPAFLLFSPSRFLFKLSFFLCIFHLPSTAPC